jgi:ABC-type polar amino acid transport system ATPase subunit
MLASWDIRSEMSSRLAAMTTRTVFAVIEEADPETFFSAPDHGRTRQFLDHME